MISDLSVISVVKRYTSVLLAISSMCFLQTNIALSESFYQTEKRGWFWFEESKQDEELKSKQITAQEATKEVNEFKQKIEGLKNLWLVNPTVENTRALMLTEAEILNQS